MRIRPGSALGSRRRIRLALSIAVLALTYAPLSGVAAKSVRPVVPLEISDIEGVWVGQSRYGHVFRLEIKGGGDAVLGFCNARGEGVGVYRSEGEEFDGQRLKLVFRPSYGTIRMSGWVAKHEISLEVRGIWRGKKEKLSLVPESAWASLQERLHATIDRRRLRSG